MAWGSRFVAILLIQIQLWTLALPAWASAPPNSRAEVDALVRAIDENEADLVDGINLLTQQAASSGTYISGAFDLPRFKSQLAMLEKRVLGWKQQIERYLTLRSADFGEQMAFDLTQRRPHVMIAYFNAVGMIARLRLLPATQELGVTEGWKRQFQLNVPLYSLAELHGMDGLPPGDPEAMGAAVMQLRSQLTGLNGVVTPFQEPAANQAVAGLSKSQLQALNLREMNTLVPLQLGEKYLRTLRIEAMSKTPSDQSFVKTATAMTALNLVQNFIDLNGASDQRNRSISLPYLSPKLQEILGTSDELGRTYKEYLRDMDEPGYREALLASFPVRPLMGSDEDDNALAMSASQARQAGLEFANEPFNLHFLESMLDTSMSPVTVKMPAPKPSATPSAAPAPAPSESAEPTMAQTVAEQPLPADLDEEVAAASPEPILPPTDAALPEVSPLPSPSLDESAIPTVGFWGSVQNLAHELMHATLGTSPTPEPSPSVSVSPSPEASPSPSASAPPRPRLSLEFKQKTIELKKEEAKVFKKIAELEKQNVPYIEIDQEKAKQFDRDVRRAEHLIFADELASLIRGYPLSFAQMDSVQRLGVLRTLVGEAKYRAVRPTYAQMATDKRAEVAKALLQLRRDELAANLSFEFINGWVKRADAVFASQTGDTSHLEYVRSLVRGSYGLTVLKDVAPNRIPINPKIMTHAIRNLGLLRARTLSEDVGAVPYFYPTAGYGAGASVLEAVNLILNAGNIASGTYYHLIGSAEIAEEALQWSERALLSQTDHAKARQVYNAKIVELLKYASPMESAVIDKMIGQDGVLDFDQAQALAKYDRGLIASTERTFRAFLKAASPLRAPDLSNPEIYQIVRERFNRLLSDLLVLGKVYGFHVPGKPTLDQAVFDGRSFSREQYKAYRDALERDMLGYGILTVRDKKNDRPLYQRLVEVLERNGESLEASLPEARVMVQEALNGMKETVAKLLERVTTWDEREPQKYLCDSLGFLQMSALMHETMRSEMFAQFSEYLARIADLYIMSCEAPTTWDRLMSTYHAPMEMLGWFFLGDMTLQFAKPFAPTSSVMRWHDRLHHAASPYSMPYFAAMLPIMGVDLYLSGQKVDEVTAKSEMAKDFFLTSPTKSAFFDMFEVMDLESQAQSASYGWYFNAAFSFAFLGLMSQGTIKQAFHSMRDQYDMMRVRTLFGKGSTGSERYDLSPDSIRRAAKQRLAMIEEWQKSPSSLPPRRIEALMESMGFKVRGGGPGISALTAPLLKWRVQNHAEGLIRRTRAIQRWQLKTLRKFGPMLDQLGMPKTARSLHPMRVTQALEEAKLAYASGRIDLKAYRTARTNAEYLIRYFSTEMSYIPGLFKRAKNRWGNRINWVLGNDRVELVPASISQIRARFYQQGKAFRNPMVRFMDEGSFPDYFKLLGIRSDASFDEIRFTLDEGIKLFEARQSAGNATEDDLQKLAELIGLREGAFATAASAKDYRDSRNYFLRNQREFLDFAEYEAYENHYATLGLLPTATMDKVRATYNQASKQLDALLSAKPELAAAIDRRRAAYDRAYQTLISPSKRSAFDKVHVKAQFILQNGGAAAFGYRSADGEPDSNYVNEKLPNYYEDLGLQFGADATAVKKAYRREAVISHPDKNPGNKAMEERFKRAAEAYGVLSDEVRRASYDNQFQRFTKQFGFEPGGSKR